MSRRFLISILGAAAILILGLLTFYWLTFGVTRSQDQAVWGAFGDYFAGILNPIFALFAFVAVLWSIHLQIKQLGQIEIDKHAQEILEVIKDIDGRISDLISSGSKNFTITQIIFEAEHITERTDKSESYKRFLRHANEPESEAEALVKNLANLLVNMHKFILRYPNTHDGTLAPIIGYYINKTVRIVPLLQATASVPDNIANYYIANKI